MGGRGGGQLYSVSGVVSVDDGSPEGAVVQLRQGDSAEWSADADGDGAYAMSEVPAGDYTIEVSLNGYESQSADLAVEGDTTKDLALTKTPPDLYTVSGVVSVSEGSPEGAAITLKQGDSVKGSAAADGDGAYAIGDVPAGDYTVEASLSGYEFQSADLAVSGNTAKNFELIKSSGEPDLYAVSGLISVNEGSPEGATILLMQGSSVKGSAAALSGGAYVINSVPAGNYTLEASLSGYESRSDTITVSGNTTKSLELIKTSEPPPPVYTVSGVISVNEGSPAGAVAQLQQGGSVKGSATADSNGAYSINNVPAGDYTLEASLSGYESQSADLTVSGNTAKNLELSKTPEEEPPGPDLYAVSGLISVNEGSPAGALIQLRQGNSVKGSATAAGGGAYVINGIAPGDYTFAVTLSGYESQSAAITVSGNTTKSLELSKTPEAPPEPPPSVYTVSGVISVNEGSPEGTVVQLKQGGSVKGSALAAGNGAYSIGNVPAGDYTIEASLSGYESQSAAITVSGDTVKNLELSKTPEPKPSVYTLSGIISVSEGSPAGTAIQLKQGNSVKGSALADNGGAYAINGLLAGNYTIEASLNGYEARSDTITVSGDTTKNLELLKTPPPVYTVSGTISVDVGNPGGTLVQLKQGDSVQGSAAADANGAYSIGNVPAGDYTLEASLPGYEAQSAAITVSGDTAKNLSLIKAPEPPPIFYTVSGTISTDMDEPAAGAKVWLRKGGETGTFPANSADYATADADGSYSIDLSGAPDGFYQVNASLEGYQPKEHGTELELPATGNIVEIDLRLSAIVPVGNVVSGIISTDVPGGPVQGAMVYLIKKGGVGFGSPVETNSDGFYAISNVPAGDGYYIEATLDGYESVYHEPRIRGDSFSVPVPYDKLDKPNLTLPIIRYSVMGRITANAAVSNFTTVSLVLKQDGNFVQNDKPSDYERGYYQIDDVAPGDNYTIEVSLAGFDTGVIGPFTVGNADLTGQNYTLLQTTYSVGGTITKADGGFGEGASVQLKQTGNAVGAPVTADNLGKYTISGILPGTYTIEVSLADYASGLINSFMVTSVNLTGKDLVLQKDGPPPITGKTLSAALAEVRTKASGEYVIELGESETAAPYDITGFNTPITITVDGGGNTVTRNTTNGTPLITLSQSGVTLIIKNVTFQGTATATTALVTVKSGATFRMETGATLAGNTKFGGAVNVQSGGTFQMETGALLTNNSVTGGDGGAVNVSGIFVMNGGSITGNKASDFGHGVYINEGGSMTMTGGSITGNTLTTDSSITYDVAVSAVSSKVGSLTLSGDARIGRIWLERYNGTVYGTITINDSFTDFDTVAVLDLGSSTTGLRNKQILKGSGVLSSYSRFVLGDFRYDFSDDTVTQISADYSIDSDGYLRFTD